MSRKRFPYRRNRHRQPVNRRSANRRPVNRRPVIIRKYYKYDEGLLVALAIACAFIAFILLVVRFE